MSDNTLQNAELAILKAELTAAKRALEIEASLERIRGRALAMRSSKELNDVAEELRRQMALLGQTELEVCAIHIYDTEGDDFESWGVMRDLSQNEGTIRHEVRLFPKTGVAILEEAIAAYESPSNNHVFVNDGEKAAGFFQMLNERYPEHFASLMALIPKDLNPDEMRAWWSFSDFSGGSIGIITYKPADQEALDLLERTASVFNLAYRRFKDLSEAEEAAKESQIEAALERVRSQAMAMQKPEDISDVSIRMFDELEDLGVVSLRSGISIPGEGERYIFHAATKDSEGKTTLVLGDESVDVHPIIRRAYAGWKSRESFQRTVLEGKDLVEYYHAVFDTMPLPDWKERMQRGEAATESFATFPFQDGWLYTFARHEFDDAELDLYQRFARVFGLAYQRYHDLKNAQAQARESQIEASLERVRGQAMSMQKPEDIGVTCHAMFEEIRALCPGILRLGIGVALDNGTMQPWLVGKDAKNHPRIYKGRPLPKGERVEIDQIFAAWEENRAHWFKESQDFLEWAHSIYDEAIAQGVILVKSDRDQFFSAFTHQTGFLYVISYEPYDVNHEVGRILNRFGGVFDLAYQRYNDLKQAEIDYAALLEEKARTEKALSDLQATQKQLVEQEKLASLGSLTAGIAHEIKNPLNFVNNFAEVSVEMAEELMEALEAGKLDEVGAIVQELMDNATQIAKHGKRADSIVKSMMQHARGGSSDRETIQVNQFLEEYSNLAWHGMRARDHGFQAEVRRDFDPNAGSLSVMPQELGRVILNLLNNAFDAIKTQKDGIVTVRTVKQDNGLQISVSDNGPGIPDAIRDKIFEPFFTTKATGEGTGLGLSLSYDIVTKGHGGKMEVGQSEEGGAAFTISLPGGQNE
ncbi:hypothetical protein HQ496_14925 [bacterium]|nr:hypothetical protein [bacterium]